MSEPITVRELKSIPEGDPVSFEANVLYQKGVKRRARNGHDFLVAHLGDRTGSFSTTCFGDSDAFAAFTRLDEGTAVRITGASNYYQGKPQPRIHNVAPLSQEEVEALGGMAAFNEGPDENPVALWDELIALVDTITPEPLRVTVREALAQHGDAFRQCPGAIAMHHAYPAGLLEHTTRMARAARLLLPLYPSVHPGLALAGIVVHDLGKVLEYTQGPGTAKTRSGILQGHVVLGYRMARQAALKARLDEDLLERLEHIILSHQGELEWGAAVHAATPEAVFVSMVDNLDAKMGMVERALRTTPDEQAFSEFIPGLQAPLLNGYPGQTDADAAEAGEEAGPSQGTLFGGG
jgi:3'-5' exoribonuclease